MSKIRVGVLRGGPSGEYDASLKTGAAVLAGLSTPQFEDKYQLHDIYISKDGTWHMQGVPVEPRHAVNHVDVFFNALHGAYGADGKVQKILDDYHAPYTGSGTLASAVSINKILSKNLFKNQGIKTPYHIILNNPYTIEQDALTIFRSFPMPAIIKPAFAGMPLAGIVARDFLSLEPAIREAFRHDDTVIVEEFIAGIPASVGVLEHFRGEDLYVLPPVEIRYRNDDSIAGTEEIVPGNFTSEQKAELARLAQEVHRALGLRHYSHTDFIVAPRRGVYVLGVSSSPELTETSRMPKALNAVGATLPDFFDHLVTLAHESWQ
jgi:D-alanine--D-alanine ligase